MVKRLRRQQRRQRQQQQDRFSHKNYSLSSVFAVWLLQQLLIEQKQSPLVLLLVLFPQSEPRFLIRKIILANGGQLMTQQVLLNDVVVDSWQCNQQNQWNYHQTKEQRQQLGCWYSWLTMQHVEAMALPKMKKMRNHDLRRRGGSGGSGPHLPLHLRNDPLAIERELLSKHRQHSTTAQQKQQPRRVNGKRKKASWSPNSQLVPPPITHIFGSDDSGLGAIAGSIVTASVCILPDKDHHQRKRTSCSSSSSTSFDDWDGYVPLSQLTDSKRLNRVQKQAIYQHVQDHPERYLWTYAIRTPQEIQTSNASNTTATTTLQKIVMECFHESIQTLYVKVQKMQQLQEQGISTDETEKEGTGKKKKNPQPLSVYSIVDGHRSPRFRYDENTTINNENTIASTSPSFLISRPWKSGDTIVYSVALASVLANVVRKQHSSTMDAIQKYPQYRFEQNDGYPTRQHIAAIHRYGITPFHRNHCKPIQQREKWDTTITNTTIYLDKATQRPHDDEKVMADKQQIRGLPIINQGQISNPSTWNSHHASYETSRKGFFSQLSTAAMGIWSSDKIMHQGKNSFTVVHAMTLDPKTGITFPEIGEVENAIPTVWSDLDNPFTTTPTTSPLSSTTEKTTTTEISSSTSSIKNPSFTRLDETDDFTFYNEPRFVEHIDDVAVKRLTNYVSHEAITNIDTQSVLDICSSWTSHVDASITATSVPQQSRRFVGLGMNAEELKANKILTEWNVQDLNANPTLPYKDNTFDVVLCQLSIDYLTKPDLVCREVGRVLKPGGKFHVLFSNRLFIQKAVGIWTGRDDLDHVYTVASYLHFCYGGFDDSSIQAKDLSLRRNKRVIGDPLYVVTARKQ